MKKEFLFLVLCIISINLMSQTLEWVNSIGGSERDISNAVLLLQDQTIIQVGAYTNSAFVSTVDTSFEVNLSSGNTVFIQKLSQSGNHLWTKQVGVLGDAHCNSACLDKDENILITGFFSGTVDFDPGADVYELSSSSGWHDYFILKLDVNGVFVWARKFGGNSIDYGYDIATDKNGNIFTTGHFSDSVDFTGDGDSCISQGHMDIFIHKLDANGNSLWVRSIGGASGDIGFGLDMDENGNVFVVGIFGESVDFNPGEGIEVKTALGDYDAFVMKLTSNGGFEWVRTISGPLYDLAYDVKCTADNDPIVTGSFFSDADFDSEHGGQLVSDAHGLDAFILKITNLGEISWVKSFGGVWDDEGCAVSIDSAGDIFITGNFGGTVDFDPGEGELIISGQGSEDVFVQKLDANGNFVWATSFGGNDRDYGYSLVSDNLNHLYVCGSFKNEVGFGFNSNPTLLTSAGVEDSYCVKIKEPDISVNEQIESGFIIFPNPTLGHVNISLSPMSNFIQNGNYSVEIYSSDGRLLQSQVIDKNNGCINFSDYNSGIYFLKLSNSNESFFKKIILERP